MASRVAAPALALLAGIAWPWSAYAQPTGDAATAQALFDEAHALEDQGKLSEACAKFLASFKLDPKSGTMLNLADCYEKNHQTASAWARYLEAATLADRAGFAERASYARDHAKALEPSVSHLTIMVAQPSDGEVVARDGLVLDPAVLNGAMPVDPGRHTIAASAPGKQTFTKDVDVKPDGDKAEVDVPPLAAQASSGTTTGTGNGSGTGTDTSAHGRDTTSTPAGGGLGGMKIAALVTGGAGVAGLVVGGIFGLNAQSTWADARDNHCHGTVCDATGVQANDDAKSAATVSTIAFVAGGVLVAGGVVLWLLAPHAEAPAPRVGIVPGIGGASLVGSF